MTQKSWKTLVIVVADDFTSANDAGSGLALAEEVQAIAMADTFLRRVGFERPCIAVAGVNPHAEENGLFGDEKIATVALAIEAMKTQGIEDSGPSLRTPSFCNAREGGTITI